MIRKCLCINKKRRRYFKFLLTFRMPSILRNSSRFRRDQRQPPEEEEMWFNEDDDFEDVPADKITPDLDNSISKSYCKA